VHFLSLDNADCIFIDVGHIDIIIDGGNNEDGPYIVEYLKRLGTDEIELMIATHPHLDHMGGLDDVLEAFEVKAVIDSGIPTQLWRRELPFYRGYVPECGGAQLEQIFESGCAESGPSRQPQLVLPYFPGQGKPQGGGYILRPVRKMRRGPRAERGYYRGA